MGRISLALTRLSREIGEITHLWLQGTVLHRDGLRLRLYLSFSILQSVHPAEFIQRGTGIADNDQQENQTIGYGLKVPVHRGLVPL